MNHLLKRIVAVGAIAALFFVPAVAFAKDGSSGSSSPSSGTETHTTSPSPSASPKIAEQEREHAIQQLNQQLQQAKQERQTAAGDVMTNLNEKLATAKLKICQNHQAQINHLMQLMDNRRQTAYDKITQIATAVENFYTTKNLSVSNYSDLVAAVDAAKSVAASTMQTQQSAPKLDCSASKPRADVSDFKTKRSDSIDAMSAYRDAVKALVKAVKAAAPTKEATHA
jgi:hypothetical protein